MLNIQIKGIKEIQGGIDNLIRDRIPIMTAMMLTELAKRVKESTSKRLPIVFDRPKTWTINSLYYMAASPEHLNAYVWFKDKSSITDVRGFNQNKRSSTWNPAGEYLKPQVYGGGRELKPYEWTLRLAGILPEGYYTVPGEGVKLDAYGNISRGDIRRILSAVRAFNENGIGYQVNQTDNSKRRLARRGKKYNYSGVVYFVGRPGPDGQLRRGRDYTVTKYPMGIWARYQWGSAGSRQGAIKPILMFVKQPRYFVRLPFFDWGQEIVDAEALRIWNKIAAETLAYHTARYWL